VVVHHGRRRTRDKEELARADVVLSTYATLQSEAAARRHGAAKDEATRRDTLLRVEWHRVVLDEAHCIRNVKSKTAQAAIALRATARWALTGTPLHNELDDLFSLFCFLHLAPLSDRDYWRSEVLRAGKAGIDRVHAVLTELMLRRTKADRSPAGAPIVELPLRTVEVRRLDASAEERALLTALSASLRSEADALGDADRRAPLLVMLLRLRQACCFSSLCRAGAPRSAPAVPQLAAIEAAVERSISRSGVDVPPAPASPAAASDADAELNEVLRQLAALRVSDKAGADEGDDAAAQGGGEEDDETVAALAASLASLSVGEMAATGDEGKKGESVKQSEGKSEPSPKPSQSQPPPPPPPPPPRPPPASSKLRFLLEHLDALRAKSPDDKVVVFSQWVSVLRLLQPPLEAAGHRCVLFDGSLSPEQRSRALAEFRGDAGVRVCLMSLMSGGVGLNLTAANHVVMFDLWWNPAVEQQAYDRVYRLGQRKPVSILRLVLRDSVEERLLALQERKAELAARALQRSAASARDLAALRALSAEELLGLLG
jgi:SNF2 family DNA or RNA helicase